MKVKSVILKLGGSVITCKGCPLTPHLKAIKRLVKEISIAKVQSLLIIHGGGSYGHPIAKTYSIAEGLNDKTQLIGVSKTHEAMVSLNKILIKYLINEGVPAFGMSPSSFIVTKKGRIHFFCKHPLQQSLEAGLVPVLYGDVVMDIDQGCAILSGDQLAAFLAVKLNFEKLIMGVDVNGIFTNDPKKDVSARLIRKLKLRDLRAMKESFTKILVPDVTGGMFGKVKELKASVSRGVVTILVNALEPNVVLKALRGEEVVGTRIKP